MPRPQQNPETSFKLTPPAATTVAAFFLTIVLCFAATQSAHAQSYQVLYSFSGGPDGAYPETGLTTDSTGDLFGTTYYGGLTGGYCGPAGCGTVFEVGPTPDGWSFSEIWAFDPSGSGGASPSSRLILRSDREFSLYGATTSGLYYDGAAFRLTDTGSGDWIETVLWQFGSALSQFADLTFDASDNLYGTIASDGTYGPCRDYNCGSVYRLSSVNGTQSQFNEAGISKFLDLSGDGWWPESGVTFDQAGNLYGTTSEGGQYGAGTVYKLTPSGDYWTQTVLYSFNSPNDGGAPYAGIVVDASGNLYGATSSGGPQGGGTVFMLSPSGGGYTFTVLHVLAGGLSVLRDLGIDTAGNLYGATYTGGAYGHGNIFKLTHSSGGWTYASLHDFSGGNDGDGPICTPILDANGNVYGTTHNGGAYGYGTVWEITP